MTFGPCEWPVIAGPPVTSGGTTITPLRKCGEPSMCRMVMYQNYEGSEWSLINLCAEHEADGHRRNTKIQTEPWSS